MLLLGHRLPGVEKIKLKFVPGLIQIASLRFIEALKRIEDNRHSFLWTLFCYLSRIGRIENSLSSAFGHSTQDTPRILRCSATDSLRCSLFDNFCHSTKSSPSLWELPGFWGSMVFHHAPIPWKGLVKIFIKLSLTS